MDLEVVGSRPTCRPKTSTRPLPSNVTRTAHESTSLSVTKTLDDSAVASFPGAFKLSHRKLKLLQPELFGPLAWIGWISGNRDQSFWLTRIEEHLLYGDSRAAVVITTSPLLIAAYTDEIDCVVLLRFSERFVSKYNLEPGSRLVTVNLYEYSDGSYETDLTPGANSTERYRNFEPLIADFLTDDVERLKERKAEIDEDEWQRTEELGQAYLTGKSRPRDGRPFWCFLPAKKLPKDVPGIEPAKPAPVTILEVPKRIIFVVCFIPLFLWGLVEMNKDLRAGLAGTVIFGSMLVLAIAQLIQLPRDLKKSVDIKDAHSFKSTYVWVGSVAASFLIGALGELIFAGLNGFWPNFAIWVSAFLTTLALYPFRGAEMKKDYPTLKPWAVLSVVWGVVSVILAHLFDWFKLD